MLPGFFCRSSVILRSVSTHEDWIGSMNKNLVDWSVYLVTDRRAAGNRSILDVVRQAIRGGVTVVQLREKECSSKDMYELGLALLDVTRPAGIPLIVNDRLDVALAIGAEGVHLGQSDLPARIGREWMGPGRIVGISATNVQEAIDAQRDGADYLGVGDVFGTPSKPDACAPIGLAGIEAIARIATVPVVAIGGVTVQNTAPAVRHGADGVAVISAIFSAPDPAAAASSLREAVQAGKKR